MKSRLFWIVSIALLLPQAASADLVFYMADGNNATENHLIKYDSSSGFSSQPIHDSIGDVYGFPSDFERVGSTVYGIDTYTRILYTIDLDQALITQVGNPNASNGSMSSLAYDPLSDSMYMVSRNQMNLYTLDFRNTAQQTYLFGNSALQDVRGLAFNPADNLLYAQSAATGNLLTIDPITKQVNALFNLSDGMGGFYDELQFFNGQLYGNWVNGMGAAQTTAQLRRIDINTGSTTNIGPLVTEISAHALFIVSVPEPSMVPIFLALTGIALGGRRFADWMRSRASSD